MTGCGEHTQSIGERLERDLDALQPLPASPYDPCDRRPARVSSLSLVRYDRNDYSVPTAYGHRPVLVRGYVDEVVIACGAEIIARHPRSYEREDFIFEPRHYLALLEHKIGALDQAAPLQGWDLPEAFGTLRRLLEARMGQGGKREYVQVLESVREHHAGLQSLRSMRRIEARRRKASALQLRFSQSLASRRQRFSQAMVRSTIQRFGRTTNPFA